MGYWGSSNPFTNYQTTPYGMGWQSPNSGSFGGGFGGGSFGGGGMGGYGGGMGGYMGAPSMPNYFQQPTWGGMGSSGFGGFGMGNYGGGYGGGPMMSGQNNYGFGSGMGSLGGLGSGGNYQQILQAIYSQMQNMQGQQQTKPLALGQNPQVDPGTGSTPVGSMTGIGSAPVGNQNSGPYGIFGSAQNMANENPNGPIIAPSTRALLGLG